MSTNEGIFRGIEVGTEIPPLMKSISKRQLFMYSASTWDFHPGHYDRDFARNHGFKDVFLDGPMDAAFMAQLITDWIGLNGTLKKLSLTYRTMVFPGDTLTCAGKATEKYIKDDMSFIDTEIILQNQDEKTVALGKATVAFFP